MFRPFVLFMYVLFVYTVTGKQQALCRLDNSNDDEQPPSERTALCSFTPSGTSTVIRRHPQVALTKCLSCVTFHYRGHHRQAAAQLSAVILVTQID